MLRCNKCTKFLPACKCRPMEFTVVSSAAVLAGDVPTRQQLVHKLTSLKTYRAHINDGIERARITGEIRSIEAQLR